MDPIGGPCSTSPSSCGSALRIVDRIHRTRKPYIESAGLSVHVVGRRDANRIIRRKLDEK